jgi:hypothetical protein
VTDLRELFHQLREEDLSRLPSPRLRGEGAPKGRVRGWAFAAIVLVASVLFVIKHHRRPPVAESIVTWKAPTDFLLRTPGSELLSTVPRIPERRGP